MLGREKETFDLKRLQTFLCGRELNSLLRHVRSLRRVKCRDEIVGRLGVEAKSVTQALQLRRLFEIRLLEPVSAGMKVLFNCVEADVQDSRLARRKVLLKLEKRKENGISK